GYTRGQRFLSRAFGDAVQDLGVGAHAADRAVAEQHRGDPVIARVEADTLGLAAAGLGRPAQHDLPAVLASLELTGGDGPRAGLHVAQALEGAGEIHCADMDAGAEPLARRVDDR